MYKWHGGEILLTSSMASWIFALRGTREHTTAKTQNRKRNTEDRQPLILSNCMMHKARICTESQEDLMSEFTCGFLTAQEESSGVWCHVDRLPGASPWTTWPEISFFNLNTYYLRTINNHNISLISVFCGWQRLAFGLDRVSPFTHMSIPLKMQQY